MGIMSEGSSYIMNYLLHNVQINYSHFMNTEQQGKPITCCHHILQTAENEEKHGNLYLGGHGSLKPEIIQKFRISAVLTVMDNYMYGKLTISERVKSLNIIEHKWLDVQDDDEVDISGFFQQSYFYIQECLKKYNVLVHCQAGVSRSASIVISYVMKKLNLPLQLANKLVVSKRYQASPNQGFWNSLRKYSDTLQQQRKHVKKERKISDPASEFTNDKYPKRFANHIISINQNNVVENGNLFLGQFSILKPQFIQSLKIKSVISVVDQQYYKRMKVKQNIQHLKIENYLWLNVKDQKQESLEKYFDETFQFIQQGLKQGNVLVHCQAGVSRSASIVIAYIIKKFRVCYNEALQFVQSKRQVVRPNSGFELKLIEYSQKI